MVAGRRAISTMIALKLEATFAMPTALDWITFQAKVDLAALRAELSEELNEIAHKAYSL
jgi:plasmid maintenance system antidote protein VapI